MLTKNLRFFEQILHLQWPAQTSKKPKKWPLEHIFNYLWTNQSP
jgi:hypothetical protein